MTMTLTIEGAELLDNGHPARLDLDRHGAVIGRSPHADWSLPDPRNLISSRHCEISYREGRYLLTDRSTNGTYLNGAVERLHDPHVLADGDRFLIGHYAIVANQAGAATQAPSRPAEAVGWDSFPTSNPVRPSGGQDGWADQPDPVAPSERAWRHDDRHSAAPSSAGAWDLPAPVARPSSWSSEPSVADAPTADDVWGKLSEQSEIDWSRGNFVSVASPEPDAGPAAPVSPIGADAEEPAVVRPSIERAVTAGDGWERFVAASGLPDDRLTRAPGAVMAAAGGILRQLVGGLMLMIEARARAKAQLGVQATGLELDGNNPLKFVRSPDRAMLQLLDEAERGFMPAERAVEDAFQDLQAHQMATLSAMRGALEGTMARFSPTAIRGRAGVPSGLARWFPVVHRARHWDTYEREFEGVVRGADEAFMDLFAKEFRQHYDRHIAEMKRRR